MFSFAWWLSLTVGFLSLSEEIVWVRVLGFAYQGQASAFAFVLTCYLIGIACGAAYGKRLCGRTNDLYGAAAMILAAASLDDVLTPFVIGHMISLDSGLLVPAMAIVLTAGIKSVLFPIVHHLGSQAQGPRVGRSVSRIYFGNILGATLGPLVTGFVALDHLSVDECFAVSAGMCVLASMACVLKSTRRVLVKRALAAGGVTAIIAILTIRPGAGSLARIAAEGPDAMIFFSANRHGIVHTAKALRGETVFGGNVYDGLASVDPDRNGNRLDRVYILGLLMPAPKHVLFVGLAGGAWLRALLGFPGVESVDVVEINPAYLDLIRQRPDVSGLLGDPKVHIHIDDGRRWLTRHPGLKFDAIVQNTTFYWRANAGNLLSREYLSLCKDHLNPGGVTLLNTTGSLDVAATTQAVFPYVYRYVNFVYASDHPLTVSLDKLWDIRRPDGGLFSSADGIARNGVVARLTSARLEPVDELLARHGAAAEIITDDNLISEYKHGLRFGPAILQALQPPSPPMMSSEGL
jgi:predicted membrane-bound spermidine synthase